MQASLIYTFRRNEEQQDGDGETVSTASSAARPTSCRGGGSPDRRACLMPLGRFYGG